MRNCGEEKSRKPVSAATGKLARNRATAPAAMERTRFFI
jgi:hypothetical protein